MIIRHCDWCGEKIESEDLWIHRGGPSVRAHSRDSGVTGHTVRIEPIVFLDGASNSGDLHILCVLGIFALWEVEVRHAKVEEARAEATQDVVDRFIEGAESAGYHQP